ncbi:MAG: CinA family nicotinamide mononucleotide deamidase-related protein [Saprospiraceae bacterium]
MSLKNKYSAYLITIGDEILIGQVVDTNSTWIADKLSEIGINVEKIISIQDKESEILEALTEAKNKVGYVFITGGLGPTIDDITKRTIGKFLESEMEFNPDFFAKVKSYVEKRGAKLDDMMYNYSFFPKNITYLNNSVGTAPGMKFNSEETVYFSMPGVPNEMKAIFSEEIEPKLKIENKDFFIFKKTILTAGEMEASIADKLKPIVDNIPQNLSIAYLPNLGKVRIRITGKGTDKNKIKSDVADFSNKIETELGNIVFGYNNDIFEEIIGKSLVKHKLKLATAESCTGGMIAHKITSIPGSSEYFNGSIISYSNDIKTNLLHVKKETLNEYGAVSEQTVKQMVKGAIEQLYCDIAIGVSGIAGPGGGTPQKPVGTIWIAVGNSETISTEKLQLGNNRLKNIETSTILALNKLRLFIQQHYN